MRIRHRRYAPPDRLSPTPSPPDTGRHAVASSSQKTGCAETHERLKTGRSEPATRMRTAAPVPSQDRTEAVKKEGSRENGSLPATAFAVFLSNPVERPHEFFVPDNAPQRQQHGDDGHDRQKRRRRQPADRHRVGQRTEVAGRKTAGDGQQDELQHAQSPLGVSVTVQKDRYERCETA